MRDLLPPFLSCCTLKNRVQLTGHLGQEVEHKTFESGKSLTSISLATNDGYRNQAGEWIETTEWRQLVAWGKIAERMAKLLKKGSFVSIEGKLTYDSYEDMEGVKRTVCRVR
jgi:single-strand DNA-binding protein